MSVWLRHCIVENRPKVTDECSNFVDRNWKKIWGSLFDSGIKNENNYWDSSKLFWWILKLEELYFYIIILKRFENFEFFLIDIFKERMLKNIVVENITLPAKMNCLLLKGQKSKFFQFHRDATK